MNSPELRSKVGMVRWVCQCIMHDRMAMSSTTVDVHELPGRFAELIAIAEAGGDVIVTEGAIPRADLLALAPLRGRRSGLHRGAITTTQDFDDPMPEEFWTDTS